MFEWFPGHMAKATRLIAERARLADCFIVVLDARAPLSTYNAELAGIAPHKPCLFVIAKADLGDATKLKLIVPQLVTSPTTAALLVDLRAPTARVKILRAVQKLLASKNARAAVREMLAPRHRVFVVGVPNAGKSTLINTLAKTRVVVAANRPGVTRGLQWVDAGPVQLLDTPGILWPKFNDEMTGIKLAVIGAIRFEVVPLTELFRAGYRLLTTYYPGHITTLGLTPGTSEALMHDNLTQLCAARGFHKPGGTLDLTRGMTWFTTYLRDLKGVTYD